jgi:hypothetical protein
VQAPRRDGQQRAEHVAIQTTVQEQGVEQEGHVFARFGRQRGRLDAGRDPDDIVGGGKTLVVLPLRRGVAGLARQRLLLSLRRCAQALAPVAPGKAGVAAAVSGQLAQFRAGGFSGVTVVAVAGILGHQGCAAARTQEADVLASGPHQIAGEGEAVECLQGQGGGAGQGRDALDERQRPAVAADHPGAQRPRQSARQEVAHKVEPVGVAKEAALEFGQDPGTAVTGRKIVEPAPIGAQDLLGVGRGEHDCTARVCPVRKDCGVVAVRLPDEEAYWRVRFGLQRFLRAECACRRRPVDRGHEVGETDLRQRTQVCFGLGGVGVIRAQQQTPECPPAPLQRGRL